MRNYLLGVITALLLTILVGGGYYYYIRLSPQKPAAISVAVDPTPTLSPLVGEETDVAEQIVSAITSKNTQALEGYMADTVQVRLESSGCCGPISRSEAMAQLSYLDPATGWSFEATNPIIVSLSTASPDYYGSEWIVGVATNEYLVSFKLNNQNKIEAYNLASTYKLLVP